MLRYIALAALVASSVAFVPAFDNVAKHAQAIKSPLFKAPAVDPSTSLTELCATLAETDANEMLYKPSDKETPKVLGGVQIGLRKLVVVTGSTSGLGLNCAATLAKSGKYFVIMAVRDTDKGLRGTCRKCSCYARRVLRTITD
jgi:protochlorophyllide reductase